MRVLQLTVHYHPNLGGVETHLLDLVKQLLLRNHEVFVLTYRPISVKTNWRMWERLGKVAILRLPWLPGFFNMLATYPVWEFIYLFPGLFLILPLVILFWRPQVIHAHGLVAAFVGVVWGKLFQVRVVTSTHSIYHFPKASLYQLFAKSILSGADCNLCLSNQSVTEMKELGVPESKVGRFTYWVELDKFKPLDKQKCKQALGWQDSFVVFFLGRLVSEKGIPELLQAAKKFKPGVKLVVAGSGPMESVVKNYYIGQISQDQLPVYYNAADVVIVPSTHEEGFGRVIIEALACGTPVIAANRGAIPEAMDESVGKLIDISPENIQAVVNYFYSHPEDLVEMLKNARKFANKRYGYHNADQIVLAYNPK